MLYSLEQGPTEKKILDQCLRGNLPLPKALQNAPDLALGLALFWDAFRDLETSRPPAGAFSGPGHIPWTAISEYASHHAIVGDQREELFYHVRALDRVYLGYHYAKAEKASKQPKGKR